MSSRFLLMLVFFFSLPAMADKYYFRPDSWQRGLHLLAGGGLNGSIYHYDFERQDNGIGLNFKTDVGYYFSSNFAWEISSNVKFNWVDDFMIWDTLFTTGFRYRFEKFPFTKSKSLYTRVFVGQAPTVFFLEGDRPEVFRNTKASRIQYDGPVYGLALGNMYETKKGTVWFVEYGLSYQELKRASGVRVEDDVPQTTFKSERENQVKIYSAYVSFGVLVF